MEKEERINVVLQCIKMLLFFSVLTAAFYFGLTWMDHHEEKVHRYDNPGSGAVKVSTMNIAEDRMNMETESDRFFSRFFEFLRDGE